MRRAAAVLLALSALSCARPEETRPVAIALATDGWWNRSTGFWTAGAIQLANVHDLAIYQFTGLPGADQDTLAQTFTLTLPGYDRLPGGSDTTVDISAVVSRHAAPASGLALPIPAYRTVLLQSTTILGPNPVDLVLSGDLGSAIEATRRIGGAFNQAWRSSYWNGGVLTRTILIMVQLTSSTGVYDADSGTATLTVTEATARTGLVGLQYIRSEDRRFGTPILECPKTGLDVALDEAVRDGYTGLLVHPDGYDPAEPRTLRRPRSTPWGGRWAP